MGVISTNRPPLPTCGDDFFPIDYLIESPITTDDEEDEHEQQQPQQLAPLAEYEGLSRRRRRADNRRYPYFFQNIIGAAGTKKNLGVRKQRRLDNSRLVMALVDKEDICTDLSDTLPETVSAFTQLFLEAEKMKAWNEFIHETEEEQRAFLRHQGRTRKTSTARNRKTSKSQNQGANIGSADSTRRSTGAMEEEKRQGKVGTVRTRSNRFLQHVAGRRLRHRFGKRVRSPITARCGAVFAFEVAKHWTIGPSRNSNRDLL